MWLFRTNNWVVSSFLWVSCITWYNLCLRIEKIWVGECNFWLDYLTIYYSHLVKGMVKRPITCLFQREVSKGTEASQGVEPSCSSKASWHLTDVESTGPTSLTRPAHFPHLTTLWQDLSTIIILFYFQSPEWADGLGWDYTPPPHYVFGTGHFINMGTSGYSWISPCLHFTFTNQTFPNATH